MKYSSKIIKAGALLPDTKVLLAHWDLSASSSVNLDRFRRENLFGKSSRSRVESILAIFRQRFLEEATVTRALVLLAQRQFPAASLERLLYFHATRADQLLHDTVTKVLFPMHKEGKTTVDVGDIVRVLSRWVQEGKTSGHWSEATARRIGQGLLSTLRDFGILQGSVNKQIAPTYLPVDAFSYIAFFLKQHQPSGARLLTSEDWKLFFLPREGVERALFEAHQRELLEYHAAGSVTRLTFPADSLEEYANVLAQR